MILPHTPTVAAHPETSPLTWSLARLAEGRDPTAWALLLNTIGTDIGALARRIAGDATLADDVVQETLLLLRDHATSFTPHGGNIECEARHWILKVAANATLEFLRRQHRQKAREGKAGIFHHHRTVPPQSPDQRLNEQEEAAQLRRELTALPAIYSEALTLHYFGGHDYAALASLLHIPANTAKTRVHRGLQALRERLARGGLVLSLSTLGGLFHQLSAATVAVAALPPNAAAMLTAPKLPMTAGAATGGTSGMIMATSMWLGLAATLAVAVTAYSVDHPPTASADPGSHLVPIPLPVVSAEAQEPVQADPHVVTVRGADPADALGELRQAGGPRVSTLGRLALRVPAALRFTPIAGRDLITAVAAAQQLQVTWVHGNRDAVLSLTAADAEIERVRTDATSTDTAVRRAAFWRAGWLQDVRILPLLIAAARDADAGTAWVATSALRRLGWETVCAIDESAEDLRRQECSSPDFEVRASAMGTGQLGSDASLPFLGKALADPVDDVRTSAVDALAAMDNDRASALLEKVVADPTAYDFDFQSEVISSFGIRESEKSLELLERLLNDPVLGLRTAILDEHRRLDDVQRRDLRLTILYALERMGGERVRGILARVVPLPGEEELIEDATIQAGGDKALELVTKALDDPDANIRSGVIFSLHSAVDRGMVDGERALVLLEKALADENVEVRERAASFFGSVLESVVRKVGGERALPLLEKALAHPNATLRCHARWAAVAVGGERALDLLEKALADENADVREWTAFAVPYVGNERALDLLEKALADENADVRKSAASAVGNVGGERALDLLEKALVDQDPMVSGEAAFALGNVESKRALRVVEKALTHQDATVRTRALTALENVGGERTLELLEQALTDADATVRRTVIGGLEHRGGEQVLGLLERALADEDGEVRSAAANALGNTGHERAVGLLTKTFSDHAAQVRCSVISGLKRLHRVDAETFELLERALADAEIDVRRNAISALHVLGSEQAFELLEKAFFRRERFAKIEDQGEGHKIISALGDMRFQGYAVHALGFLEQLLAEEERDGFRFHTYFEFSGTGQNDAVRTRVLERLAEEQDVEVLRRALDIREAIHPLMIEALKKHPLIKEVRETVVVEAPTPTIFWDEKAAIQAPKRSLEENTPPPGANDF